MNTNQTETLFILTPTTFSSYPVQALSMFFVYNSQVTSVLVSSFNKIFFNRQYLLNELCIRLTQEDKAALYYTDHRF